EAAGRDHAVDLAHLLDGTQEEVDDVPEGDGVEVPVGQVTGRLVHRQASPASQRCPPHRDLDAVRGPALLAGQGEELPADTSDVEQASISERPDLGQEAAEQLSPPSV